MKRIVSFSLVLVLAVLSIAAQGAKEDGTEERTLTVYAYDSFYSEWGPGPELIPLFEEKTGIKVDLIGAGDANEMLSRVILEGDGCPADVVIGITDDMAYKAYDANLFEPFESPLLENIDEHLFFDPEHRLIPFDYGVFSFVIDSESGTRVPESLMDLTDPYYKDKVVLIDPRTSSVGLGLLMWTYNVLGDDYLSWWEGMKDNMLTMADGWSTAYGLFTEGEAPLVISYTTSPVYHVLNGEGTRYQAVIFDEGHQETIEAMGIMKNSRHKDEARQFMEFILTDGQADIAILNSMYPVNNATELPDAYQWAPKPEKLYKTDTNVVEFGLDDMMDDWIEVMTK